MKQIGNLTLYTVIEISEKLGIHPYTLRRYIRQKKLAGRKVGNKYFITADSLRVFFEGGNLKAALSVN
jgi:excisionase family DNA binding protein